MKKSKILDFIFGYEISEKSFESSKAHHVGKTFSDRLLSGVGSSFAKKILKNPVMSFFRKLNLVLSDMTLRAYSSMLLAFGIMTLVLGVLGYIFTEEAPIPYSELLTGGICVLTSVPGLFIDSTLADTVASSKMLSAFFFEVLCLKRARSTEVAERTPPVYLCIFIGILVALSSLFLPPFAVLIARALALYLGLALSSPEFSFMITLLLIPIAPIMAHSSIILACLVLVSTVSFLFKVALGKRILHFEQYDFLLILAACFILISGVFNKGLSSFENAIMLIILMAGYTLAGNLIVNKRLADNAVNIIIFSSIPVGVYGIVYYFLLPINPGWLDPSFLGVIGGRAVATFGNPNVYSVFLIVAIIFSITYALDKSRGAVRLFYTFAAGLNIISLWLTYTRGAWCAIILSILAYFVLHFKKTPKLLLIPLALSPLSLFILPEAFTKRLLSVFNMSDSSIATRLSIWRSSLEMLKSNLFTGVGVGRDSFTEEFKQFAEEGLKGVEHSHNLFLELACQCGIFLALTFTFLLLVRLRHVASYKPYIKGSSLTSPITMTGLSLFSLICFGCTDYIWYDSSMFLLFWVVFGIGSATLRIAKREYEEKLNYRGSESSAYSAVADISVSEE